MLSKQSSTLLTTRKLSEYLATKASNEEQRILIEMVRQAAVVENGVEYCQAAQAGSRFVHIGRRRNRGAYPTLVQPCDLYRPFVGL